MKKFSFKNLKKPLLIAEIGNNHEGSFQRAKKLIDLAKEGGADAVKFQTINPKKYYHYNEKKQLKKYNKFKLTNNQFRKLALYSKQKKLLGTLSDGDLRKAVLSGMKLTDSINDIYNKSAIFFYKNN